MSKWNIITNDLKMDSMYGDFELENSDIVINTSLKDILKDLVIERFKTGFNDFILQPNYGANLQEYLGKGISTTVKEEVKEALSYSLTYDDFLNYRDFDIYVIEIDHTLRIQLYIRQDREEDSLITSFLVTNEGINFD